MNKRNINIIFIALISITFVAGILHTTLACISIYNNIGTSAPYTLGLLLLIPYALVLVIEVITFLLLKKKLGKK